MLTSLYNELDQFEALSQNTDQDNSKISAKGIYWHIDHCLKVINKTTEALANSDPKTYQGRFNPLLSVILAIGRLPRGKAKAPDLVVSQKAVIEKTDLEKQIATARQSLHQLKTLPADTHFDHPFFGPMRLKKTLKITSIHNRHHLKIIQDIKGKA